MTRFLIGLVFGGCGAAITWAGSQSTTWTFVVGGAVAALAWFGEAAVDAIADALDDLF